MPNSEDLTVYFDGAYPLCDREISYYRCQRDAVKVCWVDVSKLPHDMVAPGLSREQALARFHVRDSDGRVFSGGEAFAKLGAALPAFEIWGRLFQRRPFKRVLNGAYNLFLPIRPRLQSFFSARQSRKECGYPAWLIRELRSDHAGETGAVAIYQGILATSRDAHIRRFAEEHLETERRHLASIETLLPRQHRSVFLPLWRMAGFLTGALPAVFGQKTVFATIDAVETFVDRHYADQVNRLTREGSHDDIRILLEGCRLDEVSHRDEAREALQDPLNGIGKIWCWVVGFGSSAAVAVARRL